MDTSSKRGTWLSTGTTLFLTVVVWSASYGHVCPPIYTAEISEPLKRSHLFAMYSETEDIWYKMRLCGAST
jgi:hypothetical protein